MARKDDRRIQRTRKALRDALYALVLDRGYDDLSVQDITDKANLGRATFYLHYREKDELLEDLLRELTENFTQRSGNKIRFSDLKTLQSVFEYAENYYDFYRIMTIGKGGIIGAPAGGWDAGSSFLAGVVSSTAPRMLLGRYVASPFSPAACRAG